MASSVYSRTLRKAAELIGGQRNLCRYLHVPSADLQKWIDDKAMPPMGVFLKVVDLIISETPAPPGSSEPDEPSAPRDCSGGDGPAATRY